MDKKSVAAVKTCPICSRQLPRYHLVSCKTCGRKICYHCIPLPIDWDAPIRCVDCDALVRQVIAERLETSTTDGQEAG